MGSAPQPTDQVTAAADGAVTVSGTSRILPNAVYRALADVGYKLLSIAFFVVMARMLGQSAFGSFTFGLAFAALVTVMAGFGQDAVLTREVARDRRRVDAYFANTFAIKLLSSLPVLALAVGAMVLLDVGGRTRNVATLLSVAVLAELLTNTCFAVFQAFERLEFMPIVVVAQRVVTAGAGIAAMAAGAGVETVAAIYLVGSVVGLAIAVVLQFRYVARPRLAVDISTWWPLMRVALPVGVALVFLVTLFRVDAGILQIFEPDSVVGQYGAAYRLFEAPLFISWAVAAAVYPVMARMAADPALKTVFERALKLAVVTTLPLTVAAALLGTPLVELVYGDAFHPAGRVLELLSPAIVLYSFNHVSGVLLLAVNRQRTLAVIYGLLAAENIAANFATIPSYGMNAAAVNTTVTEVLAFVALVAVTRDLGIAWPRVVAGSLLGGALAAAAMAALRGSSFGLALATGAVGYAVVVAAFERRVYPQDVQAVWKFVRRRAVEPV